MFSNEHINRQDLSNLLNQLRNFGDVQAKNIPDSELTVTGSDPASLARGERLRQAVRSVGTAKLVAELTGVPLSTLNAYLAGREMRVGTAAVIAEATKVSLEWLATGHGPERAISLPQLGIEQKENTISSLAQGTVLISRYDARAAAGVPMVPADAAIIDKIVFSESWIRTVLRRRPADLTLIECHGDSMEPTLRDGDVIMVDTSVSEVHSARIYVIDLDGSLLVKRIQRMFDGRLRIISDNARYEAETVTPSEQNPLRIVGEVVWQSGISRS